MAILQLRTAEEEFLHAVRPGRDSVRFSHRGTCAGNWAWLSNCSKLDLGPVSVELRRVNTIFGSNNANPLYGTYAPGDTKLFLVQQGTVDANPDLPGKVLYINPSVVDGPVGTLIDFSAQLPGVLDITHFEKGLLGVAFHPDFNNPPSPAI